MKAFKYIISFALVFLIGCTKDDNDLSFLGTAVAPTEVNALFQITQDNTGLVTITPYALGAVSFNILLGDGSAETIILKQGENLKHIYEEGSYSVKIEAIGITGLKSEVTKNLVVSFSAPQNLEVNIANDAAITKKVNVIANADFAMFFEVYFGEPGMDNPVIANIGETASYTYQQPGTYTIRVVAMGGAIETTEYTQEFEVTEILQPVTAAPTPKSKPEDVISLFSDTYTNINLSELNPNWGQTTTQTTIKIEGNNTWVYNMLNYTGIVTDYGNPTNLSSMEYVHFDYWTADGTKLGLKLVNTSYADGNPLKEDIENVGTMTQGAWVSVDIPLSDYTTDISGITQLLFDSLGATSNVFIDNLYFWKSPAIATAPNVAAPNPTINSANVISIFSDAYTGVTLNDLNPNWGQTTTLTPLDISGNNIWLYESLNFSGIITDYGNPTNLSGMDYVHFDYFTPDADVLGLKIVNTVNGNEDIKFVGTTVKGTWVSVTIPLNDYAIDRSAVTQLIWDTTGGSAKVYIDNFFFYSESGSVPTVIAPEPTINASKVISIFSDTYSGITLNEVNPNWGQTTTLTNFSIAGNNIWKYDLLNFSGIVTDYGNPTDLSGMDYLHFDYWTPDATVLGLKIVNTVNGNEDTKFVASVVTGTWVSVTIPLSDYAIDASAVTQLIWDTTGGNSTVYIDNLYFHN